MAQYIHNHEPSAWLRGQLDALSHRIQSGKMNPCPHLAPGMIAAVALWKPNLAYCGDCMKTNQMRVHGDAEYTCDRCGVVAETIHSNFTSPAPTLLVMLGLCPACQQREIAS
jgi:hypothetical protein